jgi:hypothetical protein
MPLPPTKKKLSYILLPQFRNQISNATFRRGNVEKKRYYQVLASCGQGYVKKAWTRQGAFLLNAPLLNWA